MNILVPEQTYDNLLSKVDIELIQKQEYQHLGKYCRRRTHNLYQYNPNTQQISRVDVEYSSTIHIVPINGILTPVDFELERATVDSRMIFFEALNDKAANGRLRKWKAGIVKELFNLKPPTVNTIKLF
jgi:hypothetical protein